MSRLLYRISTNPTSILFSCGLILLIACSNSNSKEPVQVSQTSSEFIKGLSFVGPPREIDQNAFNPVVQVNAEWISLMPYAYCPPDDPSIIFDSQWQWWGEKTQGVKRCVEMARAAGLRIMLKPHLWIGHGIFTGTYEPKSKEGWKSFEEGYRKYMMNYARLADSMQVELLCIGTEMEKFVSTRKSFWKGLIKDIRNVYKGKLTYAANWDEYADFPFWEELDLIGIDAYFPLSSVANPEEDQIDSSWTRWVTSLNKFSEKESKRILFTEIGYRSCEKNLLQPWTTERNLATDIEAQNLAYSCLFKALKKSKSVDGMFVWKWHAKHNRAGGLSNNRFTPQNKPSEELLRKFYEEN